METGAANIGNNSIKRKAHEVAFYDIRSPWGPKTKIEILFHCQLCILCGSHNFRQEEGYHKQKNLKCDICHAQHETILHPAKSPPES